MKKVSALLSGKIDKYEYPAGEKMLPSDQSQIKEQTKFTYSPFEKAFKKQNNWRSRKKKTSWDQSFNPDQQLKSMQNLFLKDLLDKEAKGKIDKVKTIEWQIIRDGLIFVIKKGWNIFSKVLKQSFWEEIFWSVLLGHS